MTAFRGVVSGSAVSNADDAITLGAVPNLQVGDLLLAAVAGAVNTSPTYYLPTGWRLVPDTIAFDTGTPGVALGVYYKRATADDLGDSTYGWDPAHGAVVGLTAYSPSAPGREVRVAQGAAAAASTSSATRTTPSLTTTGSRWLVAFYADRSGSTWTVPTGQTQRHAISRGSGAISLLVTDSAGDVAAGTYSRTATASASTGTRVEALVALEDVPAAPIVTVPSDLTLEPFQAITLQGTSTDGSVTWARQSGLEVTLVQPGNGRVYLVGPATMEGGQIVLRASATANGQTGRADITLTVPAHSLHTALGDTWRPVQMLLPGQVPFDPPPSAPSDTTAPTTTMTAPAAGATTGSTANFDWTYNDG